MVKIIQSLADVEKFFSHLILVENLNFHPDEDFRNYIHMETYQSSYTEKEADLRNHLLEQCFEICEKYGVEIYQIGYQILIDRLEINS